jgi:signal transduction histidine kinase
LAQILINLVDNAIKFSARGERKAVDLGCRRTSEGTVLFTVRDYGPGVPRDQMKRIFRLFYRAGDALTRETVGTGIGLALVRELARAMGGHVEVVNREPGAELRVSLPALAESAMGSPRSRPLASRKRSLWHALPPQSTGGPPR